MAAPISPNRNLLITNFLDNPKVFQEFVDTAPVEETSTAILGRAAECTLPISERARACFQRMMRGPYAESHVKILNSLLGEKRDISWYQNAQFTTEAVDKGDDRDDLITIRAPLCISRLLKIEEIQGDEGLKAFYSVLSKHIVRQNPEAPPSIEYAKEHAFASITLFERAYEDYTLQKKYPMEYAKLQPKKSDEETSREERLEALETRYSELSPADQVMVKYEIWKIASESRGGPILEDDFGGKNLIADINRLEIALNRVILDRSRASTRRLLFRLAVGAAFNSNAEFPDPIFSQRILPGFDEIINKRLEDIQAFLTKDHTKLPKSTCAYIKEKMAEMPEVFNFIRDSIKTLRDKKLLEGKELEDCKLPLLLLHEIFLGGPSYDGDHQNIPILTIPKLIDKVALNIETENTFLVAVRSHITLISVPEVPEGEVPHSLEIPFAPGLTEGSDIRDWIKNNKETLSKVITLTILGADGEVGFIPRGFCQFFSDIKVLSIKNLRNIEIYPNNFNGFTSLKKLELWDNNLSEIPPEAFKGLITLKRLEIWNNNLSAIPLDAFKGLIALESLDLRNNNLSEIPSPDVFKGLISFNSLDLARNSISEIPPDAFKGIPLMSLGLAGNRLSEIHPDTFKGLIALQYVNLRDNLLEVSFVFLQSLLGANISLIFD